MKVLSLFDGISDNYFIDQDGNKVVSNTQAYKALGNSFTVPVIKHLIQSIFDDKRSICNNKNP